MVEQLMSKPRAREIRKIMWFDAGAKLRDATTQEVWDSTHRRLWNPLWANLCAAVHGGITHSRWTGW